MIGSTAIASCLTYICSRTRKANIFQNSPPSAPRQPWRRSPSSQRQSWHTPQAHAAAGAFVRSQIAPLAPDDSGATIQAYAQRILLALTHDSANNWVRYWQARADCDTMAAYARGYATGGRERMRGSIRMVRHGII